MSDMRRALLLVCILTLLLSSAPLARPVPAQPIAGSKLAAVLDKITPALLTGYLTSLVSYGPRVSGTYGCLLAGAYINDQFTSMGLATRFINYSAWGNRYNFHHVTDRDVEATLPGTNTDDHSVLLFNAHFDNAHLSVGANDDGTGAAAVLAAAYALSHFTFNRTIRFVEFSGEEQGLLGSRAYLKEIYPRGDDVLLDVDADMIGHAVTTAGAHAARLSVTEDTGFATTTFQIVNAGYIDFNITTHNITRITKDFGGSDYSAFVNDGYEAVACWEAEHDPNMHTPADNLSNVNIPYLVNYTKLIAGSLALLADADPVPPQVRLVSPAQGTLSIHSRLIKNIDERKTICLNDVWLWAEVFHPSQPILRVDFYMDNKLAYSDTTPPYNWHLERLSIRKHTITVIAYDSQGRTTSDIREIHYVNLLRKK